MKRLDFLKSLVVIPFIKLPAQKEKLKSKIKDIWAMGFWGRDRSLHYSFCDEDGQFIIMYKPIEKDNMLGNYDSILIDGKYGYPSEEHWRSDSCMQHLHQHFKQNMKDYKVALKAPSEKEWRGQIIEWCKRVINQLEK